MKIDLKYGLNPHQGAATFTSDAVEVLNGEPGYINMLDALIAWQLVRELNQATGRVSAASFKHLSPAGAAIAGELTASFRQSQFIRMADPSQVANAYLRARGGDRLCSFGDAAAVSAEVDLDLAQVLKGEVSDLIIAPGYTPEALDILRTKKGGRYLILRVDPQYEPPSRERRELFGATFEQERNSLAITHALFERASLTPRQVENLLVATIALKYTQSNSVTVAYDGQVIGVGAGQQSRVHCTRLACDKADKWLLQQHPRVLALRYAKGVTKQERVNAVDRYLLWDSLSPPERRELAGRLTHMPDPLSRDERSEWLASFSEICLSSDAYFPFRDSIDRAAMSRVSLIAHPGGSVRDDEVKAAAEEQGIRLLTTGVRLFLH